MKHPALLEIPQRHILTSFAAITLGASPLDPPPEATEVAALAERLAEPRGEKRPGDVQATRALRSVYALTRDHNRVPRARGRAGSIPRPRASMVLDAMLTLSHRQRAALALRHVFGLSPAGAARVLGVSTTRATEIVETGKTRLANALGGRVDVARHLRSVGVLLRSAASEAPTPSPAVSVGGGRPVFRLLLSAIADAPAHGRLTPAPPLSPRPVYDVRGGARSTSGRPRVPAPPVLESPRRTGLLVAACVAVLTFLGAFAPSAFVSGGRVPIAAVPVAPAVQQRVAAPPAAPSASFSVVVRAGDSLWSIAGRVLGSGERWTEIWRANAGRLMDDGMRFLDRDLIRPGWRLRLPAR